jgi:hypothetical protein
MGEFQGYSVGKGSGAFWFGIDLIVATLVIDTRFSSWNRVLQLKENQNRTQRNFNSNYYQNCGKDAAPSCLKLPHITYNA